MSGRHGKQEFKKNIEAYDPDNPDDNDSGYPSIRPSRQQDADKGSFNINKGYDDYRSGGYNNDQYNTRGYNDQSGYNDNPLQGGYNNQQGYNQGGYKDNNSSREGGGGYNGNNSRGGGHKDNSSRGGGGGYNDNNSSRGRGGYSDNNSRGGGGGYNDNSRGGRSNYDNDSRGSGGGYNDSRGGGGYNDNSRGGGDNSRSGYNIQSPALSDDRGGKPKSRDTIYITGLGSDVTDLKMSDFFGKIGLIKEDKYGKPKIWIYFDKITGLPKGDATITYEDESTCTQALDWFNGTQFLGKTIHVERAEAYDWEAKKGAGRGGRGGGGGGRGGRGGGRY